MRKTANSLRTTEKTTLPYSPQDRIKHPGYGHGTILEVNERQTTIDFDEAGTRKFVTSMVELSTSATPAPEKPKKKKRTTKRSGPKKVA